MPLVFDTLKLSKTLGKAFTPEQAEVLTEALTISVGESLATKADLTATTADINAEFANVRTEIAELETRLTAKIAELETRLMAKIAAVETMIANNKAELIRWIVASFVGNVVTMITIAKFVAHP